MNLADTMRLGDYAIDKALSEEDRREALEERRQQYVNKRSEEIFERRTKFVSHEDTALALELMSSRPGTVLRLMEMIHHRDDPTAQEMRAMIHATILTDSIDTAITEFRALEAEPPSQERH